MKTTPVSFALLAALALSTQAHAATSPVKGSCHANVFDANGSIVRQSDVALTPVDPAMHYGLALEGNVEGARVMVQLNVGRYDKIGQFKTDKVFLEINTDKTSLSTPISGRALIQGDELNGDLVTPGLEVDCTVTTN